MYFIAYYCLLYRHKVIQQASSKLIRQRMMSRKFWCPNKFCLFNFVWPNDKYSDVLSCPRFLYEMVGCMFFITFQHNMIQLMMIITYHAMRTRREQSLPTVQDICASHMQDVSKLLGHFLYVEGMQIYVSLTLWNSYPVSCG